MKTKSKKDSKKSKEEILAELRAKRTGIVSKVEESMGVKNVKTSTTIEVGRNKKKVEEEKVTTQNYSVNKEVEKVANKIYNNLLDKINESLESKGVQIAARAEMKEVRYNEKNYINKIHDLTKEGYIYAFPIVDTSDNYKAIGMMFQKIVKKTVK